MKPKEVEKFQNLKKELLQIWKCQKFKTDFKQAGITQFASVGVGYLSVMVNF